MEISHRPMYDTKVIEEVYTRKDGVPVKYVCSSAVSKEADYAVDIFYRETPHPEFGNKYFGIGLQKLTGPYIINADNIENLDFNMIEDGGKLHYSKHRHDFNQLSDIAIDGGRAYCRLVGDLAVEPVTLKVKNGIFVNG